MTNSNRAKLRVQVLFVASLSLFNVFFIIFVLCVIEEEDKDREEDEDKDGL